MDSLESASSDEQSKVDSSTESKPKRKSLLERQLETNLTLNAITPKQAEGGNTSRYGRTRHIKNDSDFLDVNKSMSRIHNISDPHEATTDVAQASTSVPNNLENQIINIYNTNLSLSRFGPEKANDESSSIPKTYLRQDLLQNKELLDLNNSHNVTKHGTHLNNILERTFDESSLNTYDQGSSSGSKASNEVALRPRVSRKSKEIKPESINDTNSSVVKILDFDDKKETKFNSKKPTRKSTESGINNPNVVSNKLARKSMDARVNTTKKSELDDKNRAEAKDKIPKNELFEIEAQSEYQVGDLAWARMGTFPFWPCIVTRDPSSNLFMKKKLFGRMERFIIHVTFLGDNGSRSWVMETLLRKFLGKKEFFDARDQFTPESKKKDPKLYAAFFVSDKKQVAWSIAVEEAELLLREPKRLRTEAFHDMLLRSIENWNSIKSDTAHKLSRTDNDFSLSESLLDTLFSEVDSKTNRSESKKIKKRSFDVSDVVTACLDDMAAKTGISMIQKQSHMDRWLQKAKSITPEKYVKTKVNNTNSKKKKQYTNERRLSSSKKSSSSRTSNGSQHRNNTKGYVSDHCSLDVSEDSLILDDTEFIIENGKDTHDDLYNPFNNNSKANSGFDCLDKVQTSTNGGENDICKDKCTILQPSDFNDQIQSTIDVGTQPAESLHDIVILNVETISPSIFDVDVATQVPIANGNEESHENVLFTQSEAPRQSRNLGSSAILRSKSNPTNNLQMDCFNNIAVKSEPENNLPKPYESSLDQGSPSLLSKNGENCEFNESCFAGAKNNTNLETDSVPQEVNTQLSIDNLLLDRKTQIKKEKNMENKNKIPNGKESVLDTFKKSYVKLFPIDKLIFDVDVATQEPIAKGNEKSDNENVLFTQSEAPRQSRKLRSSDTLSSTSNPTNLLQMDCSNNTAVKSELENNLPKPYESSLDQGSPSLLSKKGENCVLNESCFAAAKENTNLETDSVPPEINTQLTIDNLVLDRKTQKTKAKNMENKNEIPNGKESVLEETFKKSYVEKSDNENVFFTQSEAPRQSRKLRSSDTLSSKSNPTNQLQMDCSNNTAVKSELENNLPKPYESSLDQGSPSLLSKKGENFVLNESCFVAAKNNTNLETDSVPPEVNTQLSIDNLLLDRKTQKTKAKNMENKNEIPNGKESVLEETFKKSYVEKSDNENVLFTQSEAPRQSRKLRSSDTLSSKSNPTNQLQMDCSNNTAVKIELENNLPKPYESNLDQGSPSLLSKKGENCALNESCFAAAKNNTNLETDSVPPEVNTQLTIDNLVLDRKMQKTKAKNMENKNEIPNGKESVLEDTFKKSYVEKSDNENVLFTQSEAPRQSRKLRSSDTLSSKSNPTNILQMDCSNNSAVKSEPENNLTKPYESSLDQGSPSLLSKKGENCVLNESCFAAAKNNTNLETDSVPPEVNTQLTIDNLVLDRKMQKTKAKNMENKNEIPNGKESVLEDTFKKSYVEKSDNENVLFTQSEAPRQSRKLRSSDTLSSKSNPTNILQMDCSNNSAVKSEPENNLTKPYESSLDQGSPSLLSKKGENCVLNESCFAAAKNNTNLETDSVPPEVNTQLTIDNLVLDRKMQKTKAKNMENKNEIPNGKESVLEDTFKKSYVKLIPIEKLKDQSIRHSMDDSIIYNKQPKDWNLRSYDDSFSNAYVSIVPLEKLKNLHENEIFINQCISLKSKTKKANSKRKKLKLIKKPETNGFFDSFKGKGERHPDFLKYLELHQDRITDENPELNSKEIVSYLYGTWLYENNSKARNNKNCSKSNVDSQAIENNVEVTSCDFSSDSISQPVNCTNDFQTIKRLTDCLNIAPNEDFEAEDNSSNSIDKSILHNGTEEKVRANEVEDININNILKREEVFFVNRPVVVPTLLNVSSESASSFENCKEQVSEIASQETHDKTDKHRECNNIPDGICNGSTNDSEIPTLCENGEVMNDLPGKDDPQFLKYLAANENHIMDKHPEFCYLEIIEFLYKKWLKQKYNENSAMKTNVQFMHESENTAKDLENNDTSNDLLKIRRDKPINGKSNTFNDMSDPDFLKYLEMKQDNLIEQHPELTENEIISYLHKTWLYQESQKSEKKGNKIKNHMNSYPNEGRSLQAKPKVRKSRKKSQDQKDLPQKDIEISPRENSRKSASKPFYIDDDFSDNEQEIKLFEIFKNNSKSKIDESTSKANITNIKKNVMKQEVEEVEIVDGSAEETYNKAEEYFSLLKTPKPNAFKGLVREKVCEICEIVSNLIKCKSCHGMFHLDCCIKKENDVEETNTSATRGRKKKKLRGRKPKALNDSGSHDSGDQEMSFEECCPTYDVDTFEAQTSELMKEMIKEQESQNYNYYSDDELVNWSDSLPGKCEIVDIKLKPSKPVMDISNFKCPNCEKYDTPVCFVCKNAVSPKAQIEHRQKCQVAHCNKYYHLECLDYWPQTQFHSGNQSKNKRVPESFETFACPRHVCHTCVCDDPRGCKTRFSGDKLARCIRCPATYHTFTKCLPAGSQIVTGSHIICPRHHENKPGKVPHHVNTGWCFICALGGSLICCEYCPTSFHAECLNIKPPEGGYMCEECETGRLPLYGEMVWVKLGHYRWWPALILHPSEVPENVLQVKHSPGEFVVRFFGQYDHYWVNRGRVFPYQEGDTGKLSSQKSKLDAAFTLAIEHAHRAWDILKSIPSNEVEDEELVASLMPPHYVKLKVNKPVGSVCNFKVDSDEASLTQCDCNPNEEEPCGPNSCCLNRMLLTECGPACRAGDRCHNRAFEKRQYPKLTPYRTPHRGWGLKTLEDIRQGQFVIEYVGELIDEEEFRRRMRRKHEIRDENYYFLTLDKERMIDAGPKGNLARFMNHCCEPNCETQKWTVLGDVRVGLFAMKDIPANSEVTFNYNLECAGIEKKQCLCGAKRCSGYIGAKPKQEETQPKKNKVLKPNNSKRKYNKKRKDKSGPSTPSSASVPSKKRGRKPKPRELTEIEKDLLIIQNATKGMSSDSEGSERSLKILKRKRDIDSSTDSRPTSRMESPVCKKTKYADDSLVVMD